MKGLDGRKDGRREGVDWTIGHCHQSSGRCGIKGPSLIAAHSDELRQTWEYLTLIGASRFSFTRQLNERCGWLLCIAFTHSSAASKVRIFCINALRIAHEWNHELEKFNKVPQFLPETHNTQTTG